MDNNELAIQKHTEWKGKIEVIARAPVGTKEELAVAYTPGVAAPCLEISDNVDLSYKYTRRSNLVAVVTFKAIATLSDSVLHDCHIMSAVFRQSAVQ